MKCEFLRIALNSKSFFETVRNIRQCLIENRKIYIFDLENLRRDFVEKCPRKRKYIK